MFATQPDPGQSRKFVYVYVFSFPESEESQMGRLQEGGFAIVG